MPYSVWPSAATRATPAAAGIAKQPGVGSLVLAGQTPIIVAGSTTTFTDNFNRANVSPMDNGWFDPDTTFQAPSQILSNRAFGTLAASGNSGGPYNDAIILRPEFTGNNYKVTGTIYLNPSTSFGGNQEVEIWLRGTSGATRNDGFGNSKAYGYEINTNRRGEYLYLSRFMAPSFLAAGGSVGAWATGDIFEAEIQGQRIIVRVRGSVVIDYTDSAAGNYTSGYPGIGFYVDNGGPVTDFGFDSVTVLAL